MIRVYAGDPVLTEQVKGWLAPLGFRYYPPERYVEIMKKAKGFSQGFVVVEITSAKGNIFHPIKTAEGKESLMQLIHSRGYKETKDAL